MKKEIVEYYCDRCGLQVLETSLNLIEFSIKFPYHRKYSTDVCVKCTEDIEAIMNKMILGEPYNAQELPTVGS